MICPKCGFDQPESPECVRCGIIISRYKGPVLGASPAAPAPPPPGPVSAAPPPPRPRPVGVEAARTMYSEPAMAAAGEGTIHGGTIYEGPSAVPVPTFGAAGKAAAPQGSFDVGKVLGESFSIYFRNFIPFALLTTFTLSPLFLLQAYTEANRVVGAVSPTAAFSTLALFLAALICPYITTAAITYGVFQQMRGIDTSIGDCLSRGLTSFLPVLFLAIVQGLAIGVGLLLCLIPGLLLALRWAVSVPAAVEERPGVFDAMNRSTYLTEGYRGEIFGILFVIGILNIGSQLLLALVAAKDQPLFMVLSGVATLLNTGLSATATAVMYYRLRSIKESIDVDQIASVFA